MPEENCAWPGCGKYGFVAMGDAPPWWCEIHVLDPEKTIFTGPSGYCVVCDTLCCTWADEETPLHVRCVRRQEATMVERPKLGAYARKSRGLE